MEKKGRIDTLVSHVVMNTWIHSLQQKDKNLLKYYQIPNTHYKEEEMSLYHRCPAESTW